MAEVESIGLPQKHQREKMCKDFAVALLMSPHPMLVCVLSANQPPHHCLDSLLGQVCLMGCGIAEGKQKQKEDAEEEEEKNQNKEKQREKKAQPSFLPTARKK